MNLLKILLSKGESLGSVVLSKGRNPVTVTLKKGIMYLRNSIEKAKLVSKISAVISKRT